MVPRCCAMATSRYPSGLQGSNPSRELGENRTFSTRGRRVRVRPARNENIGDTLQHRFTLLIAQEVSVANDASVGFGFRLAHLQNRQFEIELISRAYRVRQSHLIPTQSHQDLEVWLKLARQQDEDREGMGARCRQSAKDRMCRGLLVDMAGNRIILFREPDNLVLGEEVGSSYAAASSSSK